MSNYYINWQSGKNGSGENQTIPGKQQIVLPQKVINSTSTSVDLTGRFVVDYGLIQQENWLHLMENFASASPPPNPTIGQNWFDPAANIMYVCTDFWRKTPDKPVYHQNGSFAWEQEWPKRQVFAGLNQYNAAATILNGIVQRQGLTDFVPVYSDVNTPTTLNTSFPTVFDNNAWVIFLARLRKALRTAQQDETNVSPVGFISDGRPSLEGNTYANALNQGSLLPNFTSGYKNLSETELQLYYNNTIATLKHLDLLVT